MKLVVEFGGGLEGLVERAQKHVDLNFENKEAITCQELISYISDNLIVGRKDMFTLDSMTDINSIVIMI